MRIICVDDEKLILEMTVKMCRELPQRPEVTGFHNAEDALAWVRGHDTDIALLDIILSGTDGLTLVAKMKEINKNIVIIFLTGYAQYALDAFKVHATGYLMKPIDKERLEAEVNYAIQIVYANRNRTNNSRIFVRTFGTFEVLMDNAAIYFFRSRSKELLAFLVDKRGNFVTRATAFSALWEDQTYTRPMQKQFDVILRSLRATLEEYGIGNILEMKRGNIRVVPEKIDCDLYRFFDGDAQTVNNYRGEYMSDYSWASFTEAKLSW